MSTSGTPTLTCTADQTPRGLTIDLRFDNASPTAVYVFDFFTPEGAYVLSTDEGTLIARQALSPPPNTAAAPKVPPVEVLAAGESTTARLRLPWPLIENHPFLDRSTGRTLDAEVVRCSVGYFAVTASVPLMPVNIGGRSLQVPSLIETLAAQKLASAALMP